MESKKAKTLVHRCGLLIVALLLILGGTWADVAQGRSLYVIGSITSWGNPLPILTYNIEVDGALTFQAQQTVPYQGGGAVGIAIDWKSEYVFITYELSGVLQLLDARTMADVGRVGASGAENLAGITYDESKGLLYCVDRGTNKLYAYQWYPGTGQLVAEAGSPFALDGSSAYGIALDEENGLLYTANGNSDILVYDTSSWFLVKTITVNRPAISVAVDVFNELLYTGAGYLTDFHLNQYNLVTGQSRSVEVDPGAGVMGLAVDLATGYVYVTTGLSNRPGGDDLLVFDTSLKLIHSVLDIGDPTGIVIPARDLGYNPLNLVKEVVTDGAVEDDEEIYVGVGDTVTYRLCFENANAVRDVSIMDLLPEHVTFEGADGEGDFGHYNANEHTYSWFFPSLPAGSSTCLELRVQVRPEVMPGTRLRNHATIRTRAIPSTTVSADVIVKGGQYKPLGVSKQVVSGVQSEDGLAYANPGDTISYAIRYSNEGNDYPVTGVSIVDALPEAVIFVEAEGNASGGAYDRVQHTYTCAYPSLAPGATGTITLTAQVESDAAAGSIITNSVTMDCNETGPTTATADVVIRTIELLPLNLTKEITAGGTDPNGDGLRYVDIGANVTYLLCFDNHDNERAVEAVSIVDFLPLEMTFVRADGDGEFGRYDPDSHTYVWSMASLAPGESACLELVAQVTEDTPAGTVILNRATIDSDQTEATMADASAIVNPIDYRPLGLRKQITAGAIPGKDEETLHVGIGDEVTYQICFDSNDNDYRIYGLSLVDTLPAEVTFVSADGDGVFGSYDSDKHTYTWSYPSLLPQSSACLNLVVEVGQDTVPGTTITNYVTIDSNDIDPQTAGVSAVTEKRQIKPLILTKAVTNGIAGQDDAGTMYVSPGQEMTYTVCMTNDNEMALNNVVVTDTLPAAVTFVSADGDGDSGRYDPTTHTYTWSYSTFQPGAQVCANLTVRVNEDAGHGVTIRNEVHAEAGDITSIADIEVVTELERPLIRKTVLAPPSEGSTEGKAISVSPGEEITYEICFENSHDVMLHDVVVVDALPAGLVFIGAEGGSGYYNPASHTYTWAYPTWEPGTTGCLKLTARVGYDVPPGETLQNKVTLDTSETPQASTDVNVVVAGESPLEIALTLSPLILGRQGYNRSDQITAVLEFPEGVLESDIGPEPLQLDHRGISIPASSQVVSVTNGRVQLRAYFDLFSVLDAVAVDGITELHVGGQLQSGQAFFGKAIVLVVAVRPF